jgi:hypothetical protein
MSNKTKEQYHDPELEKNIRSARSYKKNMRRYSIISLFIFGIIMLAATIMLIFAKRPSTSEIEKRDLAQKPAFSLQSFFSGDFTDDFTTYFSDTVPFREKLVNISSYLKKARGVSAPTFYGAVAVVSDDETEDTEEITEETVSPVTSAISEDISDENAFTSVTAVTSETETAVSETSETSAEEDSVNDITEFSNNGIVVDGVKMYGEDAGVMLFGGNKTQGKRYAEIINNYKQALGSSVNVWNMVVPTSAEFYLPSKFSKYSASEKDAIDNIYANLSEDVNSVDAYSVLAEHSDEYIYFRTDHHWTPLGAYYAYTAFMDALGMEYHPIDDYTEKVKYGFVGSLYGYTGDVTLQNAPEEFHYYLPPDVTYTVTDYNYDTLTSKGTGSLFYEYVEGSNCYAMFLGADALHVKISTNVRNGRKIVVFKESYGNAFVPYLVNNFEEIYVIDIRYFGANAVNYIKRVGATDVLFIDNCFAANTSSLISGIERLYSSYTGTVVTTTAPQTSATTAPEETGSTVSGTTAGTGSSAKSPTETSTGGNAAVTGSPPAVTGSPPASSASSPAVTSPPVTESDTEKQTVVPQ